MRNPSGIRREQALLGQYRPLFDMLKMTGNLVEIE